MCKIGSRVVGILPFLLELSLPSGSDRRKVYPEAEGGGRRTGLLFLYACHIVFDMTLLPNDQVLG